MGHIPGAVNIDWHTDLNDTVTRDYIDAIQFAELMSRHGVNRDSTIVLYGDKSNWWATYTLWVFSLFGHSDIRVLDGGRDKWIAENREITKDAAVRSRSNYPVVYRDDESLRAFRDDVLPHIGNPLIDVRSPEEYSGERISMPAYPEEGAARGGHIPTAISVPWARAVNDDGTFKSRSELEALYFDGAGLSQDSSVISYCRIGERSSHSWFVLKYLLGIPKVRNYDGSWTEWGSLVRVPIAVGSEPGTLPTLV